MLDVDDVNKTRENSYLRRMNITKVPCSKEVKRI